MVEKNILDKFEEYCNKLPIIYKVENFGNYLKLSTEILFKKSESYLSLYIVVEDDGVCLSDSNSVCDICDGYYDIEDNVYGELAEKVGLDFDNFRYTKYVKLENIEENILKFEQLRNLIELI